MQFEAVWQFLSTLIPAIFGQGGLNELGRILLLHCLVFSGLGLIENVDNYTNKHRCYQ